MRKFSVKNSLSEYKVVISNKWMKGGHVIQQGQNKTLIDRKNKPPKIIKNTKKQKEWESVSMYWKISEFESTELTNVLST